MTSDFTIQNSNQLQEALKKLKVQEQESPHTELETTLNYPSQSDTDYGLDTKPSNSKTRTSTTQYSTSALLHNLAGLQTTNNTKVDNLTDAINRLTKVVEAVYNQQMKQTELLAAIVRNTAEGPRTPVYSSSKSSKLSVKDYGFTNPYDVAAELLIKILKQVEIKVKDQGIKYRSSKTLTKQMASAVIKIACNSEFKSNGLVNRAIKLPDNKEPATMLIASRIGSTDSSNPILTAHAIRELFDDSECRTFMVAFEEVMERLKTLKVLLPFYEGDMINALTYPYFDKEGNVMCTWSKLAPRSETDDENTIMGLKAKEREQLGQLVAKGVSLRAALKAVVKN